MRDRLARVHHSRLRIIIVDNIGSIHDEPQLVIAVYTLGQKSEPP